MDPLDSNGNKDEHASQEAWARAADSLCERAYCGDGCARDSEEYRSWKHGMLLLSMDAIDLLLPALGLDDFPVAHIRQTARDLLAETGAAWDYHTNPKDLPDRFLARIATSLGKEIVDRLIAWHYKASPLPSIRACLATCRMALEELMSELCSDNCGAFRGGAYAPIRNLIKDYLSRREVLHSATVSIEPISEWDRRLDEALGDDLTDFVATAICAAASDYHDALWFPRIRNEFPADEAFAVRQWFAERYRRQAGPRDPLPPKERLTLILPDE